MPLPGVLCDLSTLLASSAAVALGLKDVENLTVVFFGN
jgi:hypothetical protein